MKKCVCVLGLAAFAAAVQGAELQTAGEMLIDLDAANLEGYEAGANVEAWPNAGSEPDFAHCNTHTKDTRPTYQVRNGAPCVRFAGSSSGSLTNGVPTPAALTGNQAWTVEGWIAPTKTQTDERYWLSLTTHNGLADNNYTKSAFRLDMKDATAVDHTGATLAWGRRDPDNLLYRPVAEQWCYVAVVHEASGYERLYVNGHLASVLNGTLRVDNTEPSFIAVSGIFKRDTLGWERQIYGDVGQIRVQTGALTAAQVINNFNVEKARYGVTETPDPLWTDGGTWADGAGLAQDANLILEGDQPLVFDDGASNAVHFVTVNAAKGTGLTIDNASELVVAYGNNVLELGNKAGGTFTLDVKKGRLATPSNSITIGMYNQGVATIGGDETGTAVVDCGSSFRVGQYEGGTAALTVKKNGTLNVSNNFRLADSGAATGTATVEAGGTLYSKGDAVLASGAGTGVLDVYGTFTCDAYCLITGNTAGGTGTLNLHPGAVFNGRRLSVQDNVTTTTATLNVDSATIHALVSQTLLKPEVTFNYKNAVTFDIDKGVQSMVATILHDETEGGVATIVKKGLGELWINTNGLVAATSEISSHFVVEAGLLRFTGPDVLAAGNAATFKLAGGTISGDYAGGAAMILARLDKASVGTFRLTANNAAENLDFSQHPGVTVVTDGSFTYTGTLTPVDGKYVFRPTGGVMVYAGALQDVDGTPGTVEVYGATDADGVLFAGDNRAFSGTITVYKGVLGFSGTAASAGGAAAKISLAEGTTLKLDAALGDDFLATRVLATSRPKQILVTPNGASVPVDLSLFPGCRLGTDSTTLVAQTGAIAPTADNEYVLGGGGLAYNQKSYPGLQPSAMADTAAGPAKVVVATSGVVNLSNTANTYSGGTEVVNRGVAYLTADGFGAVPAEFDEANIYVNDGVLRSANANFALAATRGVKVGPAGAELHPWGEYTMDIAGGLTGAGALKITDGGYLALSGAHNTFNGSVTAGNSAQRLTIGGDENFSWASEGGITTAGRVILKTPADATFNDVVAGTGGLVKQGAGTLTVAKAQTYSGSTTVEAGKLVLAPGATLANSSGVVNNGELAFASASQLGAGTLAGTGLYTVLAGGSFDVAGRRLDGAPSFAVEGNASLTVDGPGLAATSAVTAADGATLTLAGDTSRQVEGFDGFVLNGAAQVAGGALKLTGNTAGQGGSAFFGRRVKVTEPWMVTFTYQAGAHGTWTEDLVGAALVIQNDAAGPNALSTDGSAVGNGLAKSVAAILRLGVESDTKTRYGTSLGGVIEDATSWRSNNIAAHDGEVVRVTLTYDGAKLICTYDCKGNHRPTDRAKEPAVDLRELLGSDEAWIGFTGATGASTGCEQTITDFTFRAGAAVVPVFSGSDDWSYAKYCGVVKDLDGVPALEVTAPTNLARTASWNKTRVNVNRAFTAKFKYRASEASSSGQGYGLAVVFQNITDTSYGDNAANFGWGKSANAKSSGFGINLYNSQSQQEFRFLEGGSFSTSNTVKIPDWKLSDGVDTEITVRYDLANLSITATRGETSVTMTRAVDLAAVLEDTQGWMGFTGSCSSKYARQYVHSLSFAYDEPDAVTPYANRFTVAGATALNLAQGAVSLDDLVLTDGASLTVAASSASAQALTLEGLTVAGTASLAAAEGASVTLGGPLAYTSATGALTLGAGVTLATPLALELATAKGGRALLDLRNAAQALTVDDFTAETADGQPVALELKDGILSVKRAAGGTLINVR